MIQFIRFILFALLFISLSGGYSCQKQQGRVFLRVSPPIDTLITDLEVFADHVPVIIDSHYHQVSKNLEIRYTLPNVVKYQVKDWNPGMWESEYTYTTIQIHEYLGEFEKSEQDIYYTLQIAYKTEKSRPLLNSYTKHYFYAFDYYEDSHFKRD